MDGPAPFTVPLHLIVLPPNLPAGLSPWVLFTIAHSRRNAGQQVLEPIAVRRHPDWPGGWQVVDGRHRYCASVMAGCSDVLAIEVD